MTAPTALDPARRVAEVTAASVDRLRRGPAAAQLGVAGAQWLAGVGNLVFALTAARVLAPAGFAELGAFLGAYVLLHLPSASIGAGAALSPHDLDRLRRRCVAAGVAGAAVLAAAAPVLAGAFSTSTTTALALAAAAPGAALLGLERGAGLGTGRARDVATGLVAEPVWRLALGVLAAAVVGPAGAALAVVAAGYASLLATRARGLHLVAPWVPDRGHGTPRAALPPAAARAVAGRVPTAVAFALVAVVQQQDLLVAKLRLAPDAAGSFAVLSTAGGAVAFATATIPLVLLPHQGRSRSADRVAVGATLAVGAAAVVAAVVAGDVVLRAAFGDAHAEATTWFPAYVATMALVGLARTLAARRCAAGAARSVVAVLAAVVVGHLVLLALVPATVPALVGASAVTSVAGVGALALPPGLAGRQGARARAALRAWAVPVDVALVGAMVAVAAPLRLLATRGLWVDEAITVSQARGSIPSLLAWLEATDVHPPLHHLLVWATIRVLGTAEWAVRLPSVVAGVALVPVAYGFARALYGRRTGLVAAALVTVSPFLVWYSQEARMYSLFVLLATGAAWAQVAALRGDGRWAWTAYALTTAATAWTQWFAVVPFAAQQLLFGLVGLRWALRRRAARRAGRTSSARRPAAVPTSALGPTPAAPAHPEPSPAPDPVEEPDPDVLGPPGHRLRHWALATAGSLLLIAPLLPLALGQLAAYGSRRSGAVDATTLSTAGTAASDLADAGIGVYSVAANGIWALFGYHGDQTMARIAACWPLLLLVAFVALGRGRTARSTGLAVAVAVPTAAFVALGSVKRDLFELRYFAAVVPLLLVLVARALTVSTRRPRALVAGALALVALSGAMLVDQQLNGANPRRYDFAGALEVVPDRPDDGDLLLYEPSYLGDVVTYYAPDVDARALVTDPDQVRGRDRVFLLATTRLSQDVRTSARVGEALARYEDAGWTVVAERREANVRIWTLEARR